MTVGEKVLQSENAPDKLLKSHNNTGWPKGQDFTYNFLLRNREMNTVLQSRVFQERIFI